ncbi:MFS transporter [Halarcobacter sp.]|uniref:MFS transporter n=1 Tax=Halarcobacter sp. TaxID=2321133 RepID=UPI0029F58E93|nr:MFS transporter [Halarcobacter sp.]
MIYYYALLAFPLATIGLPLYIYLPTFYATNVGIDIALVGIILFIARISDVFTDPLLGVLSDKCLKKYNSRKPLMIVGAFLLVISFYFLINPSLEYKSYWLFFFSVLIYFAWSMISIPYLTWSSELSTNYYEKTKLNSFREVSTILGLLLALVAPYFASSDRIEEKLNILFMVFFFVFVIFFLISMIKITPQQKALNNTFNLKDIKEVYKKIPQLKTLQLGYFFNNLANAIPATLFLLFIETVIKKEENSSEVLILYFLSGVLALPLWTLLSKKIGKKNVWIASILLASSSFIFVIFLEENDLLLFAVISIVSGLSLGADIAFPTAIQADLTQKIKTINDNISGLVFGIWTMITKISLALSIAISFGILGLVDFDKQNLTATSLLTITLLYGLVPVVLKFISIFIIFKYNEEN